MYSGGFRFAGLVDNPHVPDAGSTSGFLLMGLSSMMLYAHSRKQPA
jgi:hypothetical protein